MFATEIVLDGDAIDLGKRLKKIEKAMLRIRNIRSRMWFANPDLCIFLSNYFKIGHRYLKKIGAKKGRYLVQIGWLTFSVAW